MRSLALHARPEEEAPHPPGCPDAQARPRSCPALVREPTSGGGEHASRVGWARMPPRRPTSEGQEAGMHSGQAKSMRLRVEQELRHDLFLVSSPPMNLTLPQTSPHQVR